MASTYDRIDEQLAAAKRLRRDGPEAFDDYRDEHSAVSIDGLPALGGLPVSYESS